MNFTLVWSLAARNLFRNTRRTVITSIAVVAGVAVLIIGWGLVDGLDENVIRAQEDTISGHVLLRPAGYPDDSRSYPVSGTREVGEDLTSALAEAGANHWTERLVFSARATLVPPADPSRDVISETIRVKGVGFDPDTEGTVFSREHWEVEGTWPEGNRQIALGRGLADMMQARIGDTIDLQVRAKARNQDDEDAMGATMLFDYRVTAIVRTRNPAMDNSSTWLTLTDADELLRTEGDRSHIAVRLPSRNGADAFARVDFGSWEATTATAEVEDLLAVNTIRRRAISMVVFILLAIAGTGIANTIIMAAYERVREIGTLQAMGLSRNGIRGLFLCEGAIMGLFAGTCGALLGALVVHHFASTGIDLSGAAQAAGDLNMSTVLYMRFRFEPILWALGFGIGISILASLYPAHHAALMNPADAVRAD